MGGSEGIGQTTDERRRSMSGRMRKCVDGNVKSGTATWRLTPDPPLSEHDVPLPSRLDVDVHDIMKRLVPDVVDDAGFNRVMVIDAPCVDQRACFGFDSQHALNDDKAISYPRMVMPLRFAAGKNRGLGDGVVFLDQQRLIAYLAVREGMSLSFNSASCEMSSHCSVRIDIQGSDEFVYDGVR
ncbi:hypothetical protein [Paraburkholderia caribensis]|nr:hypothetical protein [Paraburkholderia caribensis]